MTDAKPPHRRRPRYPGTHPREFAQKYKELNPDAYEADIKKIIGAGKTPAGMHLPIMVEEVLRCLDPRPGDIAVDCTLGGGGHASEILRRIVPGGRLIGMDVDPIELPRTEARLRVAGFGPDTFAAHHGNFAGLPQALAAQGLTAANLILVDLGVSSMQLDNPDRGFSYKGVGPLDLRMNPLRGESGAQVLTQNADEPHAALIAGILKANVVETTHALERLVRVGLNRALPALPRADVKMSVRRTLQALRIAVNDEFAALDALLRVLPSCLAPRGRVAILTFHSGEDRRVKKAFQAGYRSGLYSSKADDVIRSSMEESRANRRSTAAKLRWAVRSEA
jgi:16S rRNA (cytosine1402-N4)-methyltransferase